MLPENIKVKFFRFICGDESIEEFEQWIYTTSTLEKILGNENYLNLISLDYGRQSSRYESIKILEPHVNTGEYETWKLKKLLNIFINQEGDLPLILWEFYRLYCKGFFFLDKLGLKYGLSIVVPPREYSSEYWQELTSDEKSRLLKSILPDAIDEACKILKWLNEEKIVITSEKDKFGYHICRIDEAI